MRGGREGNRENGGEVRRGEERRDRKRNIQWQ
jgi:hypothetical protein